jgi:hypothetical protein
MEEQSSPENEWKEYESTRVVGNIKTQYDQKVFLITVDPRIDFRNALTIVTKELDTSFITNDFDKRTYQILFENILEWANMGLYPLARIRLSKLFGELKLEKSVGGFERVLQGSEITGGIEVQIPQPKFPRIQFKRTEPKEKEKEGIL